MLCIHSWNFQLRKSYFHLYEYIDFMVFYYFYSTSMFMKKSLIYIFYWLSKKKFFMPENSWDCIYFDPITPKLNFPWFAKIIGYFEPHLILATVVSFIISQKIYKLAVSPNLYISYINILYAFFKIWKCYLFAILVVFCYQIQIYVGILKIST